MMGQDMEGAGRITEGRGDFTCRVALDEKSAERFVLAVLGWLGSRKKRRMAFNYLGAPIGIDERCYIAIIGQSQSVTPSETRQQCLTLSQR